MIQQVNRQKIIGRSEPRNDLERELKKAPGQRPHIYYFIGYGGMGKTMVLRETKEKAEDRDTDYDAICALLDLQTPEILSIEGLLYNLVSQLHKALGKDKNYFQRYYEEVQYYIRAENDHNVRYREERLERVYEAFREEYLKLTYSNHIILLFDTMEQFDKDEFLQDNDVYRRFFCDNILAFHGTTYVLCGRHASSDSPDATKYQWYERSERGIFPNQFYTPDSDQPQKWSDKPKLHEFSSLTSGQARLMLEDLWKHLDQQRVSQAIDFLIKTYWKLPQVRRTYDENVEGESVIADILSNPLKLNLLAEQIEHENALDTGSIKELAARPDLEEYLVSNYFTNRGATSDIIEYMALKNFDISATDLSDITKFEEEEEARRLNELHDNKKFFIRLLPNGTFMLHDEIRDMIMTYAWEQRDADGTRRLKLYSQIFKQYDRAAYETRDKILELAGRLQRMPLVPRQHILRVVRETGLPDLDQFITDYFQSKQERIAARDSHTTQPQKEDIEYWLERQNLERRDRIIIQQMRRLVRRVEELTPDCQQHLKFYIPAFEFEWYNKRYTNIDEMEQIINEAIDKLKACGVWDKIQDPYYLRVSYSWLRYLEADKQYDRAIKEYKALISRLGTYIEEHNRPLRLQLVYIRLLYRLGAVYLNKTDHSRENAEAYLMRAWKEAREEQHVEFLCSIESTMALGKQLAHDFVGAQDWYIRAIEDLHLYKNSFLRRLHLLDWMTQLGYVKRYSQPRVGIQITWVAYTYLRQVQVDTSTIDTQRTLSVLYRRNGDYEDAMWYALLSYNLARQVQRNDLIALARIEIAITYWYALMTLGGTDQFRDYAIKMDDFNIARLQGVIDQLQQASVMLDEEAAQNGASYAIAAEKIRVAHMLTRVYTEMGDFDQARKYAALCHDNAAQVKDNYRLQEQALDTLYIRFKETSDLRYADFMAEPAIATLEESARSAKQGKTRTNPNYPTIAQMHLLAAKVAQREAQANPHDAKRLLQTTIDHVILAYYFSAQDPLTGTLNIDDIWAVFEQQIAQLNASSLPDNVKTTTTERWCQRMEDALHRTKIGDWQLPDTQSIADSFPYVADLVRNNRHKLTLRKTDNTETIKENADFATCIAQHRYEQAHHILLYDDPQLYAATDRLHLALECEQYKNALAISKEINAEDLDDTCRTTFAINSAFLLAMSDPNRDADTAFMQAYAALIACQEQFDSETEHRVRGLRYRRLGELLLRYGYGHGSLHYYEQALTIYVHAGNRIDSAFCMGAIGLVHAQLGQYELAIYYGEQALGWMIEINHLEGQVFAYYVIGMAYRAWGLLSALRGAPGTISSHYDRAEKYFRRAEDLANKLSQSSKNLSKSKRDTQEAARPTIFHYYKVDIKLAQSSLARYRSSQYRNETNHYSDYLEQFGNYRFNVRELFMAEEDLPYTSERQVLEYYIMVGDYHRRRAVYELQSAQSPASYFQSTTEAYKHYQNALTYAQRNRYIGQSLDIYLSIIEMRYVGNWSKPVETPHYKQLALEYASFEDGMYGYFQNSEGNFYLFSQLQQQIDRITTHLHSKNDAGASHPELLQHRFARLETIKAYAARENEPIAKQHYAAAGRHFCYSQHAKAKISGLVNNLYEYLRRRDDGRAEDLLQQWQALPDANAYQDELVQVCWVFKQMADENRRQQAATAFYTDYDW